MIIGIAGTLGAGKGTVVEYLKTQGFAHYSSSSTLKDLLTERALPPNRANLSELANELSLQYPGGILGLNHKRAQEDGYADYVLESLHRLHEAEYVRSIKGVILGVDADVKLRYERVIQRKEGEKDNVTYEQFLSDVEREEEGSQGGDGPNIRAILKVADEIIENNGSLAELHKKIDTFLMRERARVA